MPRYPDVVKVALSGGKTAEWTVIQFRKCWKCTEPIFMCETGREREDGSLVVGPVDPDPDEFGLYHSHFETCRYAQSFRRPRKPKADKSDQTAKETRRPGPGDRGRGDG